MTNRVREKRQEMGITCQTLAEKAGMATTDLSKLERGIRHAYPGWRKRIAAALESTEEELFPEEVAASA